MRRRRFEWTKLASQTEMMDTETSPRLAATAILCRICSESSGRPAIAVECNSLPGRLHSDPADRIITATARLNGLNVVTRDRQILDYAAQGYLSALPC